MTDQSTRNALADLIYHEPIDDPRYDPYPLADAILAAGWRPTRPPFRPRDDIDATLTEHYRKSSSHCACGWSELGRSHPQHQADELLAAGWRPPARVITTAEELDALGDGAVVRDAGGYLCRRRGVSWWLDGEAIPAAAVDLPASVLLEEGTP